MKRGGMYSQLIFMTFCIDEAIVKVNYIEAIVKVNYIIKNDQLHRVPLQYSDHQKRSYQSKYGSFPSFIPVINNIFVE